MARSDDGSDTPDGDDDVSPRVTPDELRAFLSLPATLKRARGIVRSGLQHQDAGDQVNTAVLSALASPTMPRRASMQAWFDRICRNAVFDVHRSQGRRRKHEGPMPQAPVQRDEGGEPIDDPGDAIVDIDPAIDPTREDPRLEGVLLRRFLRDAVAGDPVDRETFTLMEEWSDDADERSMGEIARAHGLTEDAAYKRVERLRAKYEPRYRRWRNGMFLWLLLGTAVAIALGWWALRPRDSEIRPADDFSLPGPSASASARPPPVDSFDRARPTTPPQLPPKP